MLDIENPTQKEVDLILQVKANRLKELEKLPVWSEFEAEDAISCSSRWSKKKHQWVRDSDILIRLAFDARIPDETAQRLQQTVAGWEFIGRPDS